MMRHVSHDCALYELVGQPHSLGTNIYSHISLPHKYSTSSIILTVMENAWDTTILIQTDVAIHNW
jgi:hypothetical protein